jgi:hypothetical protein
MPTISDIPTASDLHVQLDALNRSIDALTKGSTVTDMVISALPPPDPPDPTLPYPMPISLRLDPPISDPSTITSLRTALQQQADVVTQQLVTMGYENTPTAASATSKVLPQHPMQRERERSLLEARR